MKKAIALACFATFATSSFALADSVTIRTDNEPTGSIVVRERQDPDIIMVGEMRDMETISLAITAAEMGVLVFGTLTLILHDETFIKMKPTIVYTLFAAILSGGLLFNRSFIAIMFDQMFNLTAHGWRVLTLRWALWFLAMAVLNEIIWRTQSTDFWVAFKTFGMVPLTMLFAVTQMPLIKRYHLEPASLEASDADAGDVSKG